MTNIKVHTTSFLDNFAALVLDLKVVNEISVRQICHLLLYASCQKFDGNAGECQAFSLRIYMLLVCRNSGSMHKSSVEKCICVDLVCFYVSQGSTNLKLHMHMFPRLLCNYCLEALFVSH